MTPSSSESDASRMVLTRLLAVPFGRAFQNLQGITLCDPGQPQVLECNVFRAHCPKCRNSGPWNRCYMAGVNTAETPMLCLVG